MFLPSNIQQNPDGTYEFTDNTPYAKLIPDGQGGHILARPKMPDFSQFALPEPAPQVVPEDKPSVLGAIGRGGMSALPGVVGGLGTTALAMAALSNPVGWGMLVPVLLGAAGGYTSQLVAENSDFWNTAREEGLFNNKNLTFSQEDLQRDREAGGMVGLASKLSPLAAEALFLRPSLKSAKTLLSPSTYGKAAKTLASKGSAEYLSPLEKAILAEAALGGALETGVGAAIRVPTGENPLDPVHLAADFFSGALMNTPTPVTRMARDAARKIPVFGEAVPANLFDSAEMDIARMKKENEALINRETNKEILRRVGVSEEILNLEDVVPSDRLLEMDEVTRIASPPEVQLGNTLQRKEAFQIEPLIKELQAAKEQKLNRPSPIEMRRKKAEEQYNETFQAEYNALKETAGAATHVDPQGNPVWRIPATEGREERIIRVARDNKGKPFWENIVSDYVPLAKREAEEVARLVGEKKGYSFERQGDRVVVKRNGEQMLGFSFPLDPNGDLVSLSTGRLLESNAGMDATSGRRQAEVQKENIDAETARLEPELDRMQAERKAQDAARLRQAQLERARRNADRKVQQEVEAVTPESIDAEFSKKAESPDWAKTITADKLPSAREVDLETGMLPSGESNKAEDKAAAQIFDADFEKSLEKLTPMQRVAAQAKRSRQQRQARFQEEATESLNENGWNESYVEFHNRMVAEPEAQKMFQAEMEALANRFAGELRIVENLTTPDGRSFAGRYNDLVAEISKNAAMWDTMPHELTHMFIDQVQRHGSKRSLAALERAYKLIEASPEFKALKEEIVSKSANPEQRAKEFDAEEFLATRIGRDWIKEYGKTAESFSQQLRRIFRVHWQSNPKTQDVADFYRSYMKEVVPFSDQRLMKLRGVVNPKEEDEATAEPLKEEKADPFATEETPTEKAPGLAPIVVSRAKSFLNKGKQFEVKGKNIERAKNTPGVKLEEVDGKTFIVEVDGVTGAKEGLTESEKDIARALADSDEARSAHSSTDEEIMRASTVLKQTAKELGLTPFSIKGVDFPVIQAEYLYRRMVIVNVDGTPVVFYRSTGKAGKKKTKAGQWYPVVGIDPVDGWINKGSDEGLSQYYGSNKLKAAAQKLDAATADGKLPFMINHIADVLNKNTISNVDRTALITGGKKADEFIESVNKILATTGIKPLERKDSAKGWKPNLDAFLTKIEGSAKGAKYQESVVESRSKYKYQEADRTGTYESKLLTLLENAKLQPMKLEQWESFFRNKGIKQEEITDIFDGVSFQPDETISPEEMLQTVKDNLIINDEPAIVARDGGLRMYENQYGMFPEMKNYAEIAVQDVRSLRGAGWRKENHPWPDNTVVSLRVHDVIVEESDGGMADALLVDELQSDIHQAGKKRGYKTDYTQAEWNLLMLRKLRSKLRGSTWQEAENVYDRFLQENPNFLPDLEKARKLSEDFDYAYEQLSSDRSDWFAFKEYLTKTLSRSISDIENGFDIDDAFDIPSVVHKKSWQTLGLKQAVIEAVKRGHKIVAWPTGKEFYDPFMIPSGKLDGSQRYDLVPDWFGRYRDMEEDHAKGLAKYYDEILPRNEWLKKEKLKPYKAEVVSPETGEIKPAWRVDLTDKVIADVKGGKIPRYQEASNLPKMDAEYLKAVEKGDMEAAQRMVEEAASKNPLLDLALGTRSIDPNAFKSVDQYIAFWKDRNPEAFSDLDDYTSFGESDPEFSAAQDVAENMGESNLAEAKKLGATQEEFMTLVNDAVYRIGAFSPYEKDANLKIIPLSERFNSESYIRYQEASSLPKMDADYMKAVEAGDMEAAQKMVRKAARFAGKYPGIWFHGSPSESIVLFDPSKGKSFGGWNAIGTWTTLDKKAATEWAKGYQIEDGKLVNKTGRVYPLFAFTKKPRVLDGYAALTDLWKTIVGKSTEESTPSDVSIFRSELQRRGYDSLLVQNVVGDSPPKSDAEQTYLIAFNSRQLKSADPVTKDDAGNVIPLSERFNPTAEDIRYQEASNLPKMPSLKEEKPASLSIAHEFRSSYEGDVEAQLQNIVTIPGLKSALDEVVVETQKSPTGLHVHEQYSRYTHARKHKFARFNATVQEAGLPVKGDYDKITRYLYDARRSKDLAIPSSLQESSRAFIRAIRKVLKDIRQHQIDLGLNVYDKQTGEMREGRFNEGYFPDQLSRDVIHKWQNEPMSPEAKKFRKDWENHLLKSKSFRAKFGDKAQETAEKTVSDMITAISKRTANFDMNSEEFRALRMAEGYGLPFSLVEKDPVAAITRYITRATNDLAWWQHVQSLPTMRKALKLKVLRESDDGGVTSELTKEAFLPDGTEIEDISGITAIKDLKAIRSAYQGGAFAQQVGAFNRVISSAMLGIGTGVRDVAALPAHIVQYATLKDLAGFFKWFDFSKEARAKALRSGSKSGHGYGHLIAGNATDTTHPDIFVRGATRLANGLRTVQLREFTENFSRQLTHNFGEQHVLNQIEAARGGSINARRELRDLALDISFPVTELWTKNKKLTQADLDSMTFAFVERVQGSYDERNLASFIMQEGVAKQFLSVAKWSIEKAGRVTKDIKRMPVRTFIATAIGSALAGAGIEKINEFFGGRRGYDMTMEEAFKFGDTEDKIYKAVGLMQLGAFFGIGSDLLKLAAGAATGHKGAKFNPVFMPLASFAQEYFFPYSESMLNELHDGVSNGDWNHVFNTSIDYMMALLTSSIQGLRYIDRNWMSADETREKELRRDLRVFREMTDRIESAQLTGGKAKLKSRKDRFQEEPTQKRWMSLVKEAVKESRGDAETLKDKLSGIFRKSTTIGPSLRSSPNEFFEYLVFVEETKGRDAVYEFISDYITALEKAERVKKLNPL